MRGLFDKVAVAVAKKPVNATFTSDGKKAWVIPGADGRTLDREKTAAALTAAALKAANRTAEVAVKAVEPDLTTKEAEAMGVKDVLGTFTTEWVGTADRQTNVRITTKYAGNVLLAPGDVYNFDKQIGPRTEERGYKPAPGIIGGELEDQLGGGICQVSTTLFKRRVLRRLESSSARTTLSISPTPQRPRRHGQRGRPICAPQRHFPLHTDQGDF